MPTISMLLLGRDQSASKAINKVGDAADHTRNRVGLLGGMGKKAFAGLIGAAGGVVAALGFKKVLGSSTGAFKDLALEVIQFRRVAGGTAQDASRLRFAVHESGVDVQAATKAFGIFSKQLFAAHGDQKKTAALQDLIGTSFENSHGKIRTLESLLPQISDRFAKMQDGPEKAALAMKLFGRSGTAVLPFLNKGSEGIRELMKESDKLGLTLGEKSLDKFGKYRQAVRDLDAVQDGLKVTIGGEVLPVYTRFLEFITGKVSPGVQKTIRWIRSSNEVGKVGDAISKGFRGVGDLVYDAAKGVEDFVHSAEGQQVISKATQILGDAWDRAGRLIKLAKGLLGDFFSAFSGIDDAAAGTSTLNTALDVLGGSLTVIGDAVEGPLEAFEKLPAPVRKLAVEAGLFAFVLPRVSAGLLSVGSGLVTAGAGATSFGYKMLAAETRTSALRSAVGKLGGVARQAGGVGGMLLLANSATQTSKGLGTLEGAAGGALAGFSVGGPIGAGIGALAGGLFGLVSATNKASGAFKLSDQDAKGYADSLNQVTGAATAASRAQVLATLSSNKTLQAGLRAGLTRRTLIDAALGDPKAIAATRQAIDDLNKSTDKLRDKAKGKPVAANAAGRGGGAAPVVPEKDADAYRAAQNDLKALNTLIGPTAAKYARLSHEQRLNYAATLSTAKLAKIFPRSIITKIKADGLPQTHKGLVALAHQAKLTPTKLTTLARLQGWDLSVKNAKKLLANYKPLNKPVRATARFDGAAATSKARSTSRTVVGFFSHPATQRVNVTDSGSGSSAKRYLSGLFGHDITQHVTVSKKVTTFFSGGGKPKKSAGGNALAAGEVSWVGEGGKELFVAPPTGGRVLSRADSIAAVRSSYADDDRAQPAARRSAAPKKHLTPKQRQAAKIAAAKRAREAAKAYAAKLKEDRATFRDSFVSTFSTNVFDTTNEDGTPVSFGQLLAQQTKAANDAKNLRIDLLTAEGKGLSKALIKQFLASGAQGAQALHAIAGASAADIQQLNQANAGEYNQLRSMGSSSAAIVYPGKAGAKGEAAARAAAAAAAAAAAKAAVKEAMADGVPILIQIDLGDATIVKQIRAYQKRQGQKVTF